MICSLFEFHHIELLCTSINNINYIDTIFSRADQNINTLCQVQLVERLYFSAVATVPEKTLDGLVFTFNP